MGSEGFSRFPSPHSHVGSDEFVPKSIVFTVKDQDASTQNSQRSYQTVSFFKKHNHVYLYIYMYESRALCIYLFIYRVFTL